MAQTQPSFTIGIEEEYLLVDRDSFDLVPAPPGLMEACKDELDDQVSPEFLQCQIEVGTKVCTDISQARADLRRLRAAIHGCAARFNLAPIAASSHPFADYSKQQHTDRARYNALWQDLAGVARRMLICGQHVHVGIENAEARIDLMAQASYFLPHLLALSVSSPFWKGEDTGLSSYRLTVFDDLPRTGLPPIFASWSEFERSVQAIVDSGAIEDASKIWWDLRPSARFPTLEVRICDVSPRLEDTLTIAALIQCIMRMLWRLRVNNQRWRVYDRFLIGENRWRAMRYGMDQGLIDFGAGRVKPFAELIEELLALIAEDAAALGCEAEVARAREILHDGASATRQRRVLAQAEAAGADRAGGLRAVVRSLVEEFADGL